MLAVQFVSELHSGIVHKTCQSIIYRQEYLTNMWDFRSNEITVFLLCKLVKYFDTSIVNISFGTQLNKIEFTVNRKNAYFFYHF